MRFPGKGTQQPTRAQLCLWLRITPGPGQGSGQGEGGFRSSPWDLPLPYGLALVPASRVGGPVALGGSGPGAHPPDAPTSCPGLPPNKGSRSIRARTSTEGSLGSHGLGMGFTEKNAGGSEDQGEGKGGGGSLGPGLEQRLRQGQGLGPRLKGRWAGTRIGTFAGAPTSAGDGVGPCRARSP